MPWGQDRQAGGPGLAGRYHRPGPGEREAGGGRGRGAPGLAAAPELRGWAEALAGQLLLPEDSLPAEVGLLETRPTLPLPTWLRAQEWCAPETLPDLPRPGVGCGALGVSSAEALGSAWASPGEPRP